MPLTCSASRSLAIGWKGGLHHPCIIDPPLKEQTNLDKNELLR